MTIGPTSEAVTSFRRIVVSDPVPLPRAASGHWMFVRTGVIADGRSVRPSLSLVDAAGRVVSAAIALRPTEGGRFAGVVFATAAATALRLTTLGIDDGTPETTLAVRAVGRVSAFLRLLSLEPSSLARLASAVLSDPRGLVSRLRAFGIALQNPAVPPHSYADWLEIFETSAASELPDRPDNPDLAFLVFHERAASAALDATLASLRGQVRPVTWRMVGPSEDWVACARDLGRGSHWYVGLLQAGEVLPPHAAARAGSALREAGTPAFAIADEDAVTVDGLRTDPDWRPTPNLPLMLSGTLSRGLWLVRFDVFERHAAILEGRRGSWAETARLELWLREREAGRDGGIRLPHVLSSRRADRETAPGAHVKDVIAAHLNRTGMPLLPSGDAVPIRLKRHQNRERPTITVIVPTTLVAGHAERCIAAVIRQTDYARLRMIVALSGAAPLTPAEHAIVRRLSLVDPRIEVRRYPDRTFNFARTINRAATDADGELLLLLNDDVTPIEPDWLSDMTAWLADPRIGIVGARLLYPDRTIQHAGVVIGMGGLCWHVFQDMDDAPDLPPRAALPQQLLAVTGACCLVRRDLWSRLAGMDENYPSAFNDVDFCLRAAEAGSEVVLSDATLFHEESRTYGSHWDGQPAGSEARDVARMQERWSFLLSDDPFYNPNLDLDPARAWRPAWPPRRGGSASVSGLRGRTAAFPAT